MYSVSTERSRKEEEPGREGRREMWRRREGVLRFTEVVTCVHSSAKRGYVKLRMTKIRSDIRSALHTYQQTKPTGCLRCPYQARNWYHSLPGRWQYSGLRFYSRCKWFFCRWSHTGSSLSSQKVWLPVPFFLSVSILDHPSKVWCLASVWRIQGWGKG